MQIYIIIKEESSGSMKKLLITFITLLIIYIILSIVVKETPTQISYTLTDENIEIKVEEKLIEDNLKEHINILIEAEQLKYTISLFDQEFNEQGLIKEIKTLNGMCIGVIYKDDIDSTILCYENNVVKNYHDIENKPIELINFAEEIPNLEQFSDNLENSKEEYPITLYQNNVLENHTLAISNYKGVYIIDETINNIILNDNNTYDTNLIILVDKYYLVPTRQSQEYTKLNIINIENQKQEQINITLSKNSYIQGIVDNNVYIFDKDTRKQYEIDLENAKIKEVGNSTDDIKFYNINTWEERSANDAVIENLYFIIEKPVENVIAQIGNENGFYYYQEVLEDKTIVYRSTKENPEIKTYLFEEENIKKFILIDEYIYYQTNDEIKYYSDKTNKKTLIKNEELNFNELYFNVYNVK